MKKLKTKEEFYKLDTAKQIKLLITGGFIPPSVPFMYLMILKRYYNKFIYETKK